MKKCCRIRKNPPFRELEKANCPLTDKFCAALVKCVLDVDPATAVDALNKSEVWTEWSATFAQKYALKIT